MSTITKYRVQFEKVTREFSLEDEAREYALSNNTTYDAFTEEVIIPSPYETFQARISQEVSIEFSRNLLHDWMRKNTFEGMSIEQSLWVFSRFEEFKIKGRFGEKHVDLFKMFNSGAIPTLYYCALRIEPDDMTQPYHWLTFERINWVIERVKGFLGESTSAYIESLP